MAAILFEDKAPQTCKLLWDAAETLLKNYVTHVVFTGRELSLPISYQNLDNEKVLNILPENQTVFPVPDNLIIWNAYYPYQWQGISLCKRHESLCGVKKHHFN